MPALGLDVHGRWKNGKELRFKNRVLAGSWFFGGR
ncbi:MAG: hypothetical protein ACJA1W_001279 [Akkermansiaceae bacterium]